MNFFSHFIGERLGIVQFIKKHCVIFTFLIVLFLSSISFCEQYYISAGNMFFLLAMLIIASVVIFMLMRCLRGVKAIYSYLTLLFLVIVSILFIKYLSQTNQKAIYIFILGFAILLGVFFTLYIRKKLTAESLVILLFILGILLRFTYVLYTSASTRQHDVYNFGNDGHSGYIKYLYENGHLPDFDVTTVDQFYHPPLHHIICAVWWKVLASFGIEAAYAQSSIQTLTLFYSCVCMILTYKILRQFNLKGYALVLPFAVIALHPTFVIFAASINNDILSVTFMLLAILYSIKWYKSRSLKDIIVTAMAIGLGMMTKLSAYMVCFGIGFIFLIALISDRKNYKKYLVQFAIFLVICAPLGLWWNFRNAIGYNVPFLYVQRQGEGAEWQYVGNVPTMQRLFDFSKLFTEPVFDQWVGRAGGTYNEYNPLISLLKTSVFGEYINMNYFTNVPIIAEIVLFWSNLFLALVSVVALVYFIVVSIKDKKLDIPLISLIISFILMIIFYYIFCFSYPHHCTENIRYVSPIIVLGLVFIGKMLNDLAEKQGETSENKKSVTVYSAVKYSISTLVFVFSFSSIIMFIQIA